MNGVPESDPRAGFTTAEQFDVTLSARIYVRRNVPTSIVTFLALALVISLLFVPQNAPGENASPATAWLFIVVLPLAFVGLTAFASWKQFEKTRLLHLEISPLGLLERQASMTTQIAWPDVDEIRNITLSAATRRSGDNFIAAIVDATAAASAQRTATAVIGTDGPSAVARQILISDYDPTWWTGRIGEWIRAYRPELVA